MELRQLEAFAAVATELHFGRAAAQLGIGQPTLSDLVRRLEREMGTPLLTRTTRQVALTAAGAELLGRCQVILDEIAAARAAVRSVAVGESGTVRVAITPPVAPILVPHLRSALHERMPDVELDVQRVWLPDMTRAIASGDVDVAMTCGLPPEPAGVITEIFCSEPLLVGLRSTHRLAEQPTVDLCDLAHDVLGMPSDALYPAWAVTQRQALAAAKVSPPTVVLEDTGFSTSPGWTRQPEVSWVLLSVSSGIPPDTTVRPVSGAPGVLYVLQWAPERAQAAAVARFVRLALTVDVPPGWRTEAGHLRHRR
ncbi:LysR family transcriptional regulator [Mycolicibacterium sp. CBMA 226]|uniref:LysR family transcriptional regulator n=1 Tax=Mycolicibacterium sp. CBMA 226 TaxID=2606611 RepID=UPI0012DD47EB|nr:LysR family transcriptional regulator [Mycolicibacterium sp. CBMA 226]MUL77023.1 LysR family transcriptional regulator [Mycolicibacterium sp. CBMA 226]